SDSEDESEPNDPQSAPSFVQTSEHVKLSRHSVQPVEPSILEPTPNFTSSKTSGRSKLKNRKTYFVGYDKQYASSTKKYPQKHIVPAAVLTKSKPVSVTAARPVSADVPKIMATKPRHTRSLYINPNSIIRRHKTRSKFSKTSNSSPKVTADNAKIVSAAKGKNGKWGNPQHALKDKGVIDSGCSRHMTGNVSYLSDFQELNGGYVAFRGNPKGGKITGKGKIKTGKLDFKDVYFVKELKFNLFSVSPMCDKKNKVLFTDSECLVLSPDFRLPNENQVLLRVPR
nr:ribonuclease H-like domain-containing protein [Tanacetum cinerariifolium]